MWWLKPTTTCHCVFKIKGNLQLKSTRGKLNPFIQYCNCCSSKEVYMIVNHVYKIKIECA